MNVERSKEHTSQRPGPGRFALLAVATVLLGACASSGEHVSGAMQITVRPGDTGTCDTSPCEVFLVMPPGTGSYAVTGNEVKIGDFPAGQTVSLGQLFGSNAIKVVGANVPPAYVYIPRDL
ncbi:hypothetical protein CKO25_12785 [Thiocapsa imhoffii]|uniref:Lipoprotein n=1 Tax=Thiocapsa imhoffii TaxID=382777 RepID=A0A9X0WJ27_9GAMM|nr:hypothetical protein [Thiocapsa imhoffii]MBK1645503.1 hypothetical protein [Thiocapsa imhoffii]